MLSISRLASVQTPPASLRSPFSSVQVASMREFCITTSAASLLMVAPRFAFAVALSSPKTSTCETNASASLPRASSAAALIASCGQKLGCEYPTATSLPLPLSGTLSTHGGTTIPSFHGLPHRFSFGGGSVRFCPPAHAAHPIAAATAIRASWDIELVSGRRGPANCLGRPSERYSLKRI